MDGEDENKTHKKNNELLNYDITFRDIGATPPSVFYKRGGKIEKLLNNIFDKGDVSDEIFELEEENEDEGDTGIIHKIVNFPAIVIIKIFSIAGLVVPIVLLGIIFGLIAWFFLEILYFSIINKQFGGIVFSSIILILGLLYLYVNLYDFSRVRKNQRKQQAQIIKELLEVNNNNPSLLKEYIEFSEDENYLWIKIDPDWMLTDFYKKLTIVDFIFFVLSFLAFISGVIFYGYIVSITTFASQEFSTDSIIELLILGYLIIFAVLFVNKTIPWLDKTIKLPSFRGFSLIDYKVGLILYLIPTLLFTISFFEDESLQDSFLQALFLTGVFHIILIPFFISFLPMVEIIVREVRYLNSKNKIKEHLSDVIRFEDLKHTSMLKNNELTPETNMEFLVVKSMLQSSLNNINQLPIIPNNNFGIWVLGISILFTGVSLTISSWDIILNSIFPYLKELMDSIDSGN